jgi:signal transduction histidine kinase
MAIIKSNKSCLPAVGRVQTNYDIIKADGGEIKVKTREGDGSEFTIHLPLSNLKI